jgi:uncharacterized protein
MADRPEACPLCRKPIVAAFKPFCSQGCRDRDLLNWLGEAYSVPANPNDNDEADSALDRTPEG